MVSKKELFYFTNEDGTMSQKINFRNDSQDGLSTFHFPDGSLDQETEFSNGRPNGIKIYYRGIHKVKNISTWRFGKRNGEQTIFDSLGTASLNIIFKQRNRNAIVAVALPFDRINDI